VKREKLGEKFGEFLPTKYIFHTLQGSFPCRKILRHGADGFIYLPKEVVLRFLSPLKSHRPLPGLNPRTLGPVASTITARPLRATWNVATLMLVQNSWVYPFFAYSKCPVCRINLVCNLHCIWWPDWTRLISLGWDARRNGRIGAMKWSNCELYKMFLDTFECNSFVSHVGNYTQIFGKGDNSIYMQMVDHGS
jgi:hypothetical protein